MANSIKDGIITYNSSKYKIIAETDTYYIGTGIVKLRTVLCRINKDLTGWKSKSVSEIFDIKKAIINSDGSIVAIGDQYRHVVLDYNCPGSSQTFNDAVLLEYKSDLSLKRIDKISIDKRSNITDTYFHDIIRVSDGYIISCFGFNRNLSSIILLRDFNIKFSDDQFVCYSEVRDVVNSKDHDIEINYTSSTHSPCIINLKEWIITISKTEKIITQSEQFLHGIKLVRFTSDDISDQLVNILFGSNLKSFVYDESHIFIIGDFQKTTINVTEQGNSIVHGHIQPKLFKINSDLEVEDMIILNASYDKLTIDGDKLICSCEYADPDNAPLMLNKNLTIYE